MSKFTWEEGTKVKDAYVTIDGTDYTVTPAEYSGTTPLNPTNLNKMEDGILDEIPDIVDNLETEDATKVLSAKQGKVLKDAVDDAALETYSTTETVIGTWYDGKPIYRQVVTGTTPSSIASNQVSLLSNVDRLIDIKGYYSSSTTGGIVVLSDKTAAAVQGDAKVTYFFNNDSASLYNYVFALEYTKTTD